MQERVTEKLRLGELRVRVGLAGGVRETVSEGDRVALQDGVAVEVRVCVSGCDFDGAERDSDGESTGVCVIVRVAVPGEGVVEQRAVRDADTLRVRVEEGERGRVAVGVAVRVGLG